MNISRRYLGDVFTILVLTLATGALQSLVVDSSTSKAVTEGNLWLQIMWACIYVIVAIRASRQYQAIADVVRANKLLIALVLLTLLSIVWSEDPGLTLRRSVALLATTLFGLDFAVRYSIREQLRLLAIALSGVVLLSVIVQVFSPGMIPSTDVVYPDAWIGLFGQKNEFARIVVLATMVILTAVRRTARGVVTGILAVIAALGLIFAAQSMTAFVTLGGMLLIFQFTPTLRWNIENSNGSSVHRCGNCAARPVFPDRKERRRHRNVGTQQFSHWPSENLGSLSFEHRRETDSRLRL